MSVVFSPVSIVKFWWFFRFLPFSELTETTFFFFHTTGFEHDVLKMIWFRTSDLRVLKNLWHDLWFFIYVGWLQTRLLSVSIMNYLIVKETKIKDSEALTIIDHFLIKTKIVIVRMRLTEGGIPFSAKRCFLKAQGFF